jgi:hypothetical protein
MTMPWKLESSNPLRENNLLSSSNSKLYSRIMFLMFGVKHLKSHAQVLLDRTSAPDNLWFLAQDYLSYAHKLSAYRQLN